MTWQAVSNDVAKVTVQHAGLEQSVEISVAPDGQPLSVSFARWSDANPAKTYQLQPFGGYRSEFRKFQGYRIPTHVEAGNFFGTEAYFPFFLVDLTEVVFPEIHSDPCLAGWPRLRFNQCAQQPTTWILLVV